MISLFFIIKFLSTKKYIQIHLLAINKDGLQMFKFVDKKS